MAEADDLIDRLVGQLTLAEKCRMVAGQDLWSVPGCERLGIPDWRVSDGPVGVRGRTDTTPGLVLPGPSAMAATWDVELVEGLGAAARWSAGRGREIVRSPAEGTGGVRRDAPACWSKSR